MIYDGLKCIKTIEFIINGRYRCIQYECQYNHHTEVFAAQMHQSYSGYQICDEYNVVILNDILQLEPARE